MNDKEHKCMTWKKNNSCLQKGGNTEIFQTIFITISYDIPATKEIHNLVYVPVCMVITYLYNSYIKFKIIFHENAYV